MSVSFNAASTFPVGHNPNSVVVADINADGNLDIVTGGTTSVSGSFVQSGSISVLLGDGKGQFGSVITSSGQQFGSAADIAVGDFNNDRILDVISTGNILGGTASDVFVALGDGKGTFKPSTNLLVGNSPQSVSVGDLNGDGNLDAVTANSGGRVASILLGNGTGGFQSTNSLALEGNATAVALRDFNGDNRLDLTAITITTDSSTFVTTAKFSLLLGDGRGAFTPATTIDLGTVSFGASDLAFTDFNGDGRLDVAALEGGKISILLGDPSAQRFRLVYQAEQAAGSIATGDFNGDGRVDLAASAAGSSNDNVSILLGNGAGGFSLPQQSPITNGFGLLDATIGDFNKDNKLDVVSVSSDFTDANVLLNNTTQTDAITQGTRGSEETGYIDASSEVTGSITVDLSKGTFTLNAPTRINRSLQGVDDVIGTVQADQIKGSNRKNLLSGFLGNDKLLGGNGDDRLVGGGGKDELTGGKGKDRFIFSTTPNYPEGLETPFNKALLNVDRILDFQRGTDKIVLDEGTFTVLEANKQIRFARVDNVEEARSSRATITYIQDTGRLYYNQNGSKSGFGSGGLFARLDNESLLNAKDFLVVTS